MSTVGDDTKLRSSSEVLVLSSDEDNLSSDDHSDTIGSTKEEEEKVDKLKQTGKSSTKSQLALVVPSFIDKFLQSYSKFTSKSTNTERGIKLLQWSVWLISQITKNNPRFSKDTSPSFRKFYNDLSMMRFVLRLYGFPLALDAVLKPGSWAGVPPNGSEWKDRRIIKLSNIMAWSMLIYHPLEHIAYANWTMPKLLPKVNGNKLCAWSCRFWLVFIVSDWVSSHLKNSELEGEKQLLLCKYSATDFDDEEKQKVASDIQTIEKSMKINRLQILRNICFAPPCYNWSLDNWATDPVMSENAVNGFSLAEAIVCMYQTLLSL
mmetsp:Transcript_14725/g.17929  ORF Transcript_14725/g.17929 Transcript_14725/m.17929 type:complete len:320 (-) Transcript_14725:1127-2086(-)